MYPNISEMNLVRMPSVNGYITNGSNNQNNINNMESADNYNLPYIFWFNEKMYEVDGDTFAKMSKKFDEVRQENANQYIVTKNWNTETFEAFLAACQLKPFDVNKNNAFELRELAIEWKVQTLLNFVDNYIEENHLQPKPSVDYLGILLEHVADNCDNYQDWENVAQDFNKVITDKRFEQVPAEVIFQILAIADRKGVNQIALIDFVMKLFQTDPEKAIPLMLRLDWSAMTREQIETIYTNRLTHDQNISFFIASSLSAVDNKVEIAIRNMQKRREIEMAVLKNNIRRNRELELKQRSEDYKRETDELKSEIQRQQRIIDDLEQRLLAHRDRLASEERRVSSRRTPIADDALERINSSINKEIQKLEEDAEKQKMDFFTRMDRMAFETPRIARQYFQSAAEKSESETTRAQSLLKNLQKMIGEQDQHVAKAKAEGQAIAAMLSAKIVKDKFRFDSFLRRTTPRHKAFEGGKFWGTTPAAVKASEEQLTKIEAQIDKLCPLRQSTAMSPPNSPQRK